MTDDRRIDNLTKADLGEFKDDIKEHINLTVAPIISKQQAHSKTLYGDDGTGGLVKSATQHKTGIWIVGWLATTGFGASLISWIKNN